MAMPRKLVDDLHDLLAGRNGIPLTHAEEYAAWGDEGLPWLMAAANAVRHHHHLDRVHLCGIVNARSGLCGEDCAFCAQSRHARAQVQVYPLLDRGTLVERAREAQAGGAGRFSIVTSGRAVAGEDLESIKAAIRGMADLGIHPCASVGVLDSASLAALRDAGLETFHHNLEASASFYGSVVSTRSHADNVASVRFAREQGLTVCCGGLFGMGESWAQRVELFGELRELAVDRVPINFLVPIPGTRLADRPLLPAREALAIVALARLVLPLPDLVVAGGRELVLGQLQANVFLAGANGLMVGNYLTTAGRSVADDRELVALCGLTVAGEEW